jgi:hypothetical protein
LPGRFSDASEKMHENQTLDLRKYPEHGATLCDNIDYCVGLSQHIMGDIMKLETIFLPNFVKDENWTSVLSVSAKPNQWEDTDQLDLDLCCPEQPKIPFIKIGRQEVPMQVTHQSDLIQA